MYLVVLMNEQSVSLLDGLIIILCLEMTHVYLYVGVWVHINEMSQIPTQIFELFNHSPLGRIYFY